MNTPPSSDPGHKNELRSLEKLRDRTDEIELIISGLTTVALFTLPGWLFEQVAHAYAHFSVSMAIGTNVLLLIVPGLFYALGLCFALHLLIRAYWAGLIGLRTVFPEGINWSRTPGVGPLAREYYKDQLPDLAHGIERADRVASSLFASISMIALGMIWISFLLIVVLLLGGFFSARLGGTNRALEIVSLGLVIVLAGLPVLIWLLDSVLARRLAGLRQRPLFRALVRALLRLQFLVWPQRLIMPVQLTLQSNTRPLIVLIGIIVSVATILTVGQMRLAAWTDFTLSGEFRYLDDDVAREGLRSGYYANQRSSRDRFRLLPMLDSFVQERSHLILFIPYQPLRDNLVLDQNCELSDTRTRLDCLRSIWAVSLGDRTIPTTDFLATERLDLNLRGLTGVIDLAGLQPGLHRLVVTWNPSAQEQDQPLDDRYEAATMRYDIPFLFAPAFEQGLALPAAEATNAPE